MATGKSGYIDVTVMPQSVGIVRVYWREDYDSVNNYSTITVTDVQGYLWHRNGWAKVKLLVTAGGVTVLNSSGEWMFSANADTTLRSVVSTSDYTVGFSPVTSEAIYHDDDGTKTINITFTLVDCTISSVGFDATDNQSASVSVALTAIPRASSIAATDANIGSVSTITVNRKSSAYTHTIQYVFGSLSGYITADGGVSSSPVKMSATSIGWTIPTEFYTQIPNAKTGTGTLIVTTYSGDTQIGSAASCGFTVTAAQSACTPSVSGTVVDTNETTLALTGDENVLVRFYSDVLATITAAAKNSASIASKSIAGTAVTGDTRTISAVETGIFEFAATDSRGYSNSVKVTKTLIEYIKLTNNATATRDDPTSGAATITLKGDYFNGSFGAVDNELTAKYRIDSGEYVDVTDSLVVSDNTYTASIPLTGMDYQLDFSIEVVVSDKLNTNASKTLPLLRGIPIANWSEDYWRFNVNTYVGNFLRLWSDTEGGNIEINAGNGHTNAWQIDAHDGNLRFYTWRESDGAYKGVVFMQDGSIASENLLGSYPVGTVYISTVATSPAALFGGTWTQITDRFLLAAGSTYAAGSTGGSTYNTHWHKQTVGYDGENLYATLGAAYTASEVETASARGYVGMTNAANSGTRYDYTFGTSISIMPPYLSVYVWQRTA